MSFGNGSQEFENGIKLKWEDIDPDVRFYLWLPEWQEHRFIGLFNPDSGIFFIKRFTRHRHAILNSFGISSYIVDFLEPKGLSKVVMNIEDTREVLESTLENFKSNGVYKMWSKQGFDRQLFLAIPYWDKKR